MAINITATNAFTIVKKRHYTLAKTREVVAEKVEIVAHEENLHLISNKKVCAKGNK